MVLSLADQDLIDDMKQRELHLKRRLRAADAIHYETRRFRAILVTAVTVGVTGIATGVFLAVDSSPAERPSWWRPTVVVVVVGALLGEQLGQTLLRTGPGRRLVARKESRLRTKYSGDLHAGRRWLQFYYDGEDISAFVPQILYFVEAQGLFDSVRAALDFAKANRAESAIFAERALQKFSDVARQTNLVLVSSSAGSGRPSSRMMRFITSERPGVWFVTTAPDGPKVPEFDNGRVALLTVPTEAGATISSNRVEVRRAARPFSAFVDLYRAQVPGYTDGMTEDEQQRELVYELAIQSARVDTWLDHDVVTFSEPGPG